jgi:hypothetical protein
VTQAGGFRSGAVADERGDGILEAVLDRVRRAWPGSELFQYSRWVRRTTDPVELDAVEAEVRAQLFEEAWRQGRTLLTFDGPKWTISRNMATLAWTRGDPPPWCDSMSCKAEGMTIPLGER